MTTFAIIVPPINYAQVDAFIAAMNRVFPNGAWRYVNEGQYVAARANATSEQIVRELGAAQGELGKVVVFASGGHWGWHDKALWEWLTAWGGI